ncbi:MAG: hypothetical protein GYA33_02080 [Thermogutta sp.]|nr:hypothetical protein [Thermogutta sp.]
MPFAKRDLGKIGILDFEALLRPATPKILCNVRVVSRTADDGTVWNEVRSFEAAADDDGEPFAPEETHGTGSTHEADADPDNIPF